MPETLFIAAYRCVKTKMIELVKNRQNNTVDFAAYFP